MNKEEFCSEYNLRVLDEPFRLGKLTVEEFLLLAVPIIIGIATALWTGDRIFWFSWGFGLGAGGCGAWKLFKYFMGNDKGLVSQVCYRYLFTTKKSGLPEPSVKVFLT